MVDEIVKKMLKDIDPEKGRMLDIRVLVVYEGDKEKLMFQANLSTLADLIHASSAVKMLAAGFEKTIADGKYTPEEIQNSEKTSIKVESNFHFGPKPFAEA